MFLLLLLIVLCFTACGVDFTGSAYTYHTYADPDTGVNYIMVNSSSGVAITVRYNPDGSLYVETNPVVNAVVNDN